MRGESEVPEGGRGLKPNFYQLPRPWSPWASSPFKEKTHMVEPGIEPGTSWLVVRSSDHQATRQLRDMFFNILFMFVFCFTFLFSILCFLCFCIIVLLFCVLFLLLSCLLPIFVPVSDQCHRVETQLQ